MHVNLAMQKPPNYFELLQTTKLSPLIISYKISGMLETCLYKQKLEVSTGLSSALMTNNLRRLNVPSFRSDLWHSHVNMEHRAMVPKRSSCLAGGKRNSVVAVESAIGCLERNLYGRQTNTLTYTSDYAAQGIKVDLFKTKVIIKKTRNVLV